MRKFEVVRDDCRKHPGVKIQLPHRATKGSMAYDFYSPDEYAVYMDHVVKIWTDVKAYMNDGEGLLINIRSSMGSRWELTTEQGWIDGDYADNPDNDGNIGVFLRNISDETQYIHKGDRIAQGMFVNFLTTDDDNATAQRIGGFGSTNGCNKKETEN